MNSREEIELASIGRRFIATMLDTSILVVVGVIITVALDLPLAPGEVDFFDFSWLASQSVFLLVLIFYFSPLEWLTGQTVGKRLVGIQVVGSDHSGNPSFPASLARNILRYIDYIPYLFPIIGLSSMVATKQRQRVGDIVARTRVIRTSNKGRVS
ncbi:MAG: RDD family protein [Nitrososphaerales archaeon]